MDASQITAQPDPAVAHIKEYAQVAKFCEQNRWYVTSEMLYALACEVLLKAAATRLKIEFPSRSHNLAELFGALPDEWQQKVLLEFEENANLDTLEGNEPCAAFLSVLKECSSYFIKLRYAYESATQSTGDYEPFSHVGMLYDVLEEALRPVFGLAWATTFNYKKLVPAHEYNSE